MAAPDRSADVQRLEQKIVELEVKVSFQERTIDDLDAELRRFTARVEALERELSRVRGDLESAVPETADVLAQVDADDESE